MIAFIAVLIGYLCGSIPFGLLLTKAAGLGDVRSIGSGNIGATNVLRTGNKKIAALTLFLDGLKGAVPVLLFTYFGEPQAGMIAGFAAMAGHIFPVWLDFKGGKGVATFFGVLLAGIWPIGFLAGAAWLAIATIFRFSSLASLSAAAIAPLAAIVGQFNWSEVAFTLVLAALIFWRHRANIARLRAGTEPHIGDKSEPAPAPPPAET